MKSCGISSCRSAKASRALQPPRQTIRVGEVRNDPRYLPTLDAVRSEMAVPMISRGKLVGVIDVQSTRPNAFSESDSSLLRLIASRAVSAVDNARLYRRVVTQNRTSRMLAHLSHEFSSILQLNELLARIAKSIHTLIHFDAFSILLVDYEKKCLRHRFSERFDERVSLDNIPLVKELPGPPQKAGKRSRSTTSSPIPDTSHRIPGFGLRSPFRSSAGPRCRRMDLESERIGAFTDEHVRTLSLLAPQIASSVENARLYEELGLREQRMEQDLQAARRVQSILLPRTAKSKVSTSASAGVRRAKSAATCSNSSNKARTKPSSLLATPAERVRLPHSTELSSVASSDPCA